MKSDVITIRKNRKYLTENINMHEKRPKEYYQEVFKYVVKEFNKNNKKN